MTPQQQKDFLGEQLYGRIATLDPVQAGKITGMVLQMEVSVAIAMLESPAELHNRVYEAHQCLQDFAVRTGGAAAPPSG